MRTRKSGSLEFGADAGIIRQIANRSGFNPEWSGRILDLQQIANAADLLYSRGYISRYRVKSIEDSIADSVERLLENVP